MTLDVLWIGIAAAGAVSSHSRSSHETPTRAVAGCLVTALA